MKQFSLEKWLQDKSRKVVTRDGREVDIYYSPTSRIPLIGRTSDNEIHQYTENGFQNEMMNQAKNDIFFADEEEELTEFEQELRYWIGQSLCNYENNGCISDNMSDSVNIYLEAASKKLLDLARKELEKKYRIIDKDDSNWEDGYEQGKQEALKDLPKWEKKEVFVSNEYGLAQRGDDIIITKKGYQIKFSDLEKLPKEE